MGTLSAVVIGIIAGIILGIATDARTKVIAWIKKIRFWFKNTRRMMIRSKIDRLLSKPLTASRLGSLKRLLGKYGRWVGEAWPRCGYCLDHDRHIFGKCQICFDECRANRKLSVLKRALREGWSIDTTSNALSSLEV